jgi:stage V sporulation protein R
MVSKFKQGSSILMGDNTIPGVKLPDDLRDYCITILGACREWGLDFYPTVVELLTYDEISEVAAYGGFPVRYPHWKFGMEYESLATGYEYGRHKIYEMVINTNPCYIYCLNSNNLVDHLTVVAHATGHNDFFKNNLTFQGTDTSMLNKMANHGSRIRRYMSRWGKERVTEFIDNVLRLDTLLDPVASRDKRKASRNIADSRKYQHPRRLKVDGDRLYMDPFINTWGFKQREKKRISESDAATEIGLFQQPTRDILGYLRDHAPLKPWQADIVSMLYEESEYFTPQRGTKVMNEGWASFTDSQIMARQGYVSLGQKSKDMGIVEYAIHKMGVLGGKYSENPYKLGYELFNNIEERWDKGQFGDEWEACDNLKEKLNWDTEAGLGKEKIFEVRKYYDDVNFLDEFFTEDFCREQEYYHWQHYPNGQYKIDGRDYKTIKKQLISRHLNGGLPEIHLTEPNYRGKRIFLLEHVWTGEELFDPHVRDVMTAINFLWKQEVVLSTRNFEGQRLVYLCDGTNAEKDVILETEEDHQKRYF